MRVVNGLVRDAKAGRNLALAPVVEVVQGDDEALPRRQHGEIYGARGVSTVDVHAARMQDETREG